MLLKKVSSTASHIDCPTIDMDQAERAVCHLISDDERQFQRTLSQHPRHHLHLYYLPSYPTPILGFNHHLLLPNVPVTRLIQLEILRRQHGAYTRDAITLLQNYLHGNDDFRLLPKDAQELATRLQVGLSIITYNAHQFSAIADILLLSHRSFRRRILKKPDVALKEPTLNSKQMAMAMEFYLQMDVDVFYMKTCAFRGADPSLLPIDMQGLFCGKDEPQANYELLPCGNRSCSCCFPVNHEKKTQTWPVVDFASSSMHRFINGYKTYLNCPATCQTSNIIYAMTCPCGEFDYVDSTPKTLADAMAYHREHGNRILHEKLVGSRLYRGISIDPEELEKDRANKMRLYLHSARCSVALRSFLDCNPNYWCFIPMSWQDGISDNIDYLRSRPTVSSSSYATYFSFHNTETVDHEEASILAMGICDSDRVAHYLQHIPLPPTSYLFTCRQRQKQRLFFEQFLSIPLGQQPYSLVDLYQFKIIAVLPDDRSIVLRYLIETLFILHAETKLNMICPTDGDPQRRYGSVYKHVWCVNLNRPTALPPISSTSKRTTL